MPKMVQIEVDPSWGKTARGDDKVAFDAAKARGPVTVSYVSAVEAIKLSRGLYRMKSEAPPRLPSAPSLQETPNEELKRMYVAMGGKIGDKAIKRSEIITFISAKMDALEVVDDEIQSDDEGQAGD
jgi:hypothetical protein